MHYKSKRKPGRLILLAAVLVTLVVVLWQRNQPNELPVDSVPVIRPTAHALTPEPEAEAAAEPSLILRTEAMVIRAGDTLAKRLKSLGISPQVIHELQTTEEAGPHLAKIHPGQIFTLSFTEDDELVRLEQKIDELKQLIIEKNDKAEYTARLEEKPITTYIKFASNTIEDSLFTAGSKVGLTDNMILQLASIFAWDIDFTLDIRPGDKFSVLYEERYIDGEKISPGNIVAAQFVTQGRVHEAIRFEDGTNQAEYFTPDGSSMRKAFLRSPVNFTRISSRFNLARRHPILHTIRAHKGVDYAAASGTPIKAAGNGKVIFKGVKSGYGNVVILQHGQQYSTLYAHMSRFAPLLKQGDKITQGQTIGYVGMSGLATAPHLHYEFRINNIHQDPLTVALPHSEPIAKQYKNEFLAKATMLLNQLDYHQKIDVATRVGDPYGQ
jgi:murein DD-endopeptidase MepM/ murein hydrolase activator NlpD